MADLREVEIRQRHLVAAFVSLATMVALGCGTPAPRHVILVVVDTMRGDHMSCVGGPVETPHLDALADDGVLFTQARSTAPITGPSHSSLFTGLFVHEHGVTNNAQILADDHVTLAEVAQEHGLATSAFVSLGVLRRTFGFGQGFDSYDLSLDGRWWRTAGEVNDAVFPALDRHESGNRNLLFVHYSDPHAPYGAPGRDVPTVGISPSSTGETRLVAADAGVKAIDIAFDEGRSTIRFDMARGESLGRRGLLFHTQKLPQGATIREGAGARMLSGGVRPLFKIRPPAELVIEADGARGAGTDQMKFILRRNLDNEQSRVEYRAEVEYVDREIGRLVARLKDQGMYDEAVLIVTADHGEGLGDHDLMGHIHQLYDSLLHVPLIIVAPGHLKPGLVVEDPVSLVDILPTVGDLMAWELPGETSGRSLLPLTRGSSIGDKPFLAATARPQSRQNLEALIDGGLKLIVDPDTQAVELYDLAEDPGELQNLSTHRPDEAARRLELLQHLIEGRVDDGEWVDLDDETKAKLEALGYVH
jgi:hypothetical protein